MSGKLCKAGHVYATYLTACPFCAEGLFAAAEVVTRAFSQQVAIGLAERADYEMSNNVTPVTKSPQSVTKIGRGRPKRYENGAARQKAYRQRKR